MRSIWWLSQDAFDKGLVCRQYASVLLGCLSEPFMRALRFIAAVFLFLASVHRSVSSVLVDFQVAQPPPVPKDTQQCTIEILQSVIAMTILCQIITQIIFRHDFANSFGKYVYIYHLDTLNGSPDRNFQCSSRAIYVCNFSNYISPYSNFFIQTSGGLRSCRLLGCHHSQFHSHQQWNSIRSPWNIYIPKRREQVNNYFCQDGYLMTSFLQYGVHLHQNLRKMASFGPILRM